VSPKPSILVVTSELVGPFKNGGIGTATTGLVETLAGLGHKVTVLYTGAIWHIEIDMAPWIRSWAAIGVDLVALTLADMARLAGPVCDQGLGSAWLVWDFIRTHEFDIIHFNDTLGEGYLALAYRHLGAGLDRPRLLLGLHSPTRWIARLNRQTVDNVVYAAFDWMERVSVAAADLLWCPSDYLLEWIKAEGWVLPTEVVRQQYVMPTPRLFDPDPAKFAAADTIPPLRRIERVTEIVFFGRLEERKGLRGFCAAIDRMQDRLATAGVTVSFLGKPVKLGDESSADWIRRRAARWKCPWTLQTGFGQREALAYLGSRDCVAVMASPWDNSPCTVYEAMQHGIPFLASATGGIPELVERADHARGLFPDTSDGLVAALDNVLDHGAAALRPAVPAAENRRRWADLHVMPAARPVTDPAPFPRVAVLIDGAGDGLARTLESLKSALGPSLVGIVVLAERPASAEGAVVIDTGAERLVEEALAQSIRRIPADFVLCLTAGAVLLPEALPALARALKAPDIGAGLIPAGIRADGKVIPPFGGGRGFGFFEGFAFTGGAVLARDAVLTALWERGRLMQTPFAGLVDLVAAGDRMLWPFPAPVWRLPERYAVAPVAADGARVAAFACADPVERQMIQAIGFQAYRRAFLNRKRRLLLLASGLPGFGLAAATLRRLLALWRR
jgi:glycosyltransferase involved in cell wall biosynthesis